MERLTKWNGKAWVLPQGRTSDGQSYWRIIADRLAEYENAGWVDTKDCEPLEDGEYIIQTVTGRVDTMRYTFKGGWNTSFDDEGTLKNEYAITPKYIARWYRVPKPIDVPQEWVDEYFGKGENA